MSIDAYGSVLLTYLAKGMSVLADSCYRAVTETHAWPAYSFNCLTR
jgi:hypothetical protein